AMTAHTVTAFAENSVHDPLRSLPPASSPPRLTATQLPLASDSGRHGSQRTSTSNISAMPGAPHQKGRSRSPFLVRPASCGQGSGPCKKEEDQGRQAIGDLSLASQRRLQPGKEKTRCDPAREAGHMGRNVGPLVTNPEVGKEHGAGCKRQPTTQSPKTTGSLLQPGKSNQQPQGSEDRGRGPDGCV